MRILGVDLSLTSTGLCSGPHTTTTVGYPLKRYASEADRIQRIRAIAGTVATFADQTRALVVVEDLIPGVTRAETVGLHYVVRYALTLHGIRYVVVHNSAVKRYATGRGSGAGTDKTAVAVAVLQRFNVRHDTTDETDAWVLYAMARDFYGDAIAPVPKTHRQALTAVDWPVPVMGGYG